MNGVLVILRLMLKLMLGLMLFFSLKKGLRDSVSHLLRVRVLPVVGG